jgi:uncharacterized protein YcfL
MRTARFRLLLPALCALALLGSTACRSTPKGEQNTYTGTEGSMEIGRIEGNQTLASRLRIVDPKSRRLDDGRLQVQFELHNSSSNMTEFAWTVDWFDDSGFLVPVASRYYEPVALGGGAWKTLTITAPTPAAVSWRLGITSRNEVQ